MRKLTSSLIFFSIFVLISWFALPALFNVPYPRPLGPKLTPAIRTNFQDDIVSKKPEVVLLGDSELDLGVDEHALSLLINKRFYKIGFHGSGSALWYLIVKNNIVNAAYKPEYLVIFFRASQLTTPDYRVSGKFFSNIDDYSGLDEGTLVQLAYVNQMAWPDRLAEQYIPLYSLRLSLRDLIEKTFMYNISGRLMGDDQSAVDQAMNNALINVTQVNPNEAISDAESYLYTSRNLDFDQQLNLSFLPEIVSLCEQNDIKLIFVHERTLQYPTPVSEPKGAAAYLNSLAEYLDANNIPLIDSAYDVRLNPGLFVDQIHMNSTGKAFFTRLLGEELNHIIK
jgi:hypothetical protein